MRILITDHLPRVVAEREGGLPPLEPLLRESGHEVRWLLVTNRARAPKAPGLRPIYCEEEQGLPFPLPGFSQQSSGLTFAALSGEQLNRYRQVLRRYLDEEVNYFNPQIVHSNGIWLWAQLALESGVPYVATALGPELDARATDTRYLSLADQAAENAGRILVTSAELAARVRGIWNDVQNRIVLIDANRGGDHDHLAATLGDVYQRVLLERFGTVPR